MAVALCGVASAVQAAVPSPWLAQDIGAPSPAGSSTYSSGTFTINASGTDIWNSSDQFHFVSQPVTGDFSITTKVDSIAYTDPWAKAGVMIRGSLNANAVEIFTGVTPAPGVTFQSRSSAGASTSSAGFLSGIGAPRWVRLARTGSSITASMSVDGSQWTTINTITVSLSPSVYVGLAVTSHSGGVLTTASLSNVAVTQVGGSVPSPQKAADIGAPAIAGSTIYNAGQYTIKAQCKDIWNTSDQFQYVYQPLSGDAEIIAHVTGLGASAPWAKSGVMIRENLTASARHADAMITAANGYTFQRRIDPAGYTDSTTGFSGAAPAWVRLVRSGNTFTAYRSTDGTNWTALGSDTVPMTDPVYIGLAVTSNNASLGTISTIDSVKVTMAGGTTNQPPTVSLTAPTAGASFTAPATIQLSANASDPENSLSRVDFYAGSVLLSSSTSAPYAYTWSSVAAGTYTVTAVATDAGGAKTTSAPVAVTVTPAAGSSTVTLTPSAINFGNQAVGVQTASMSATLKNAGTGAISFTGGVMTGSTDFTYLNDNCGLSLAAGASCVLNYAFKPSSAGAKTGGNTINFSGGSGSPAVVSFTGTGVGDTTPPSAPASLAATAASASQINLTWTASTDNVGVAGYQVERCQGSGCTTFAQVGTPTGASFNDTTGLSAGTTYTYRVRAKDAAGNVSAYSGVVSATTSQTAAPMPKSVAFTASADHNTTVVTGYRFNVYAAGANPATATPVATSDLGKPTPDATNTITVDRSTFFSGLAAGNYVATVSAYGPGGSSASTSVTFTR